MHIHQCNIYIYIHIHMIYIRMREFGCTQSGGRRSQDQLLPPPQHTHTHTWYTHTHTPHTHTHTHTPCVCVCVRVCVCACVCARVHTHIHTVRREEGGTSSYPKARAALAHALRNAVWCIALECLVAYIRRPQYMLHA